MLHVEQTHFISTVRIPGQVVLFIPVSAYETLAGESEVVLGDT